MKTTIITTHPERGIEPWTKLTVLCDELGFSYNFLKSKKFPFYYKERIAGTSNPIEYNVIKFEKHKNNHKKLILEVMLNKNSNLNTYNILNPKEELEVVEDYTLCELVLYSIENEYDLIKVKSIDLDVEDKVLDVEEISKDTQTHE